MSWIIFGTLSTAIAPRWLAFTICALAMFVIIVHLLALNAAHIHPSRKRIRLSNGLLMLAAAPAVAYAVGVASTDDKRTFVIAWLVVMCLMVMIIGVALVDMLNTARLTRLERRGLRRELDDTRAELARMGGLGGTRDRNSSPGSSA